MRERSPCVYIVASRTLVLYIGVTSDLYGLFKHKKHSYEGFSAKYRCGGLVYY
jgi:predicted GIY-YIG superfamily endonuclease